MSQDRIKQEREAKARQLLAEAAKLQEQAWELLAADATEEEIEDAVGSLWEQYRDLGMDALDEAGTKACALLEWREYQQLEAEEEADGDQGEVA